MLARTLVVSLVLCACTSAETPAGQTADEPVKVEEPAKVEAKVEAPVTVEAPTTAAPPPVAVVPSDEPIVGWWCTGYYKYGEGEPERVTACRSTQSDCASLEKGVMAGRSGIVQTAKGIGIGSSRAETMKQYGKLKDPDFSDDLEKQLIAGSIYGGLMFNFEKAKVVSIFLGAAAE